MPSNYSKQTFSTLAKSYYFVLLTAVLLLTSCSAGRDLTYFSDLGGNTATQTTITNNVEPKIEPGDLLSIVVNSLSAESNLVYNSGILLPATAGSGAGTAASNRIAEGYLVDSNGEINFPQTGKIKLGGLTREEATDKITTIVGRSVKGPTVTIRYLNFRVTVIGEVNRPATFTVPTEKINVLEALGLAGDMTGYGRRDDVLIIREKNNKRTTTRLNLNKKEVLNSPFFYLQQNDIVYVEPDKAKSLQVSTRAVNLPIYLSIASLVLFVASSVVFR